MANPIKRSTALHRALAPTAAALFAAVVLANPDVGRADMGMWMSHGLQGQSVNAVAIGLPAGGMVYAATGGGLFMSADGGGSWQDMGLANVTTLGIDPLMPGLLYAGTESGGVFMSEDDGATWRPINMGLPGVTISILALDPTTPATLYAGTGSCGGMGGWIGDGLYKSTDGGTSWHPTGLTGFYVRTLAIDPSTPSTLYAGLGFCGHMGMWSGDGVFKTTDGGDTWRPMGLNSVNVLAIDPKAPGTVYAGTQDGGVFKSSDGGDTWDFVDLGLGDAGCSALAIDPVSGTLYAGMDFCGDNGGCIGYGVFDSADDGGSWNPMDAGLPHDTMASSFAIDPRTHTVYAGTDQSGVFAVASVPAVCGGDCHGTGQVTIDDVMMMVNVALGGAPMSECEAGDIDRNGQITVSEIVAAVNNALNGCGG